MNKLIGLSAAILCMPFLIFIVLTDCFGDELEYEYHSRGESSNNTVMWLFLAAGIAVTVIDWRTGYITQLIN